MSFCCDRRSEAHHHPGSLRHRGRARQALGPHRHLQWGCIRLPCRSAIADLYANIQCKQAEDALKSFAKAADKSGRPAKDDDEATDKSAAKVAAQAKEITALRQRAMRMEATINKLDPQALKDLKTPKTAKKPAGAAPRAPAAAKTGAAKDAAPPSEQ